MNRVAYTLSCLLLAAGARATEPAAPAPAPAQGNAPEAAGPATTTAPAAAEAKRVQDAPADDRFKPSEKISEDLSVSFPADI